MKRWHLKCAHVSNVRHAFSSPAETFRLDGRTTKRYLASAYQIRTNSVITHWTCYNYLPKFKTATTAMLIFLRNSGFISEGYKRPMTFRVKRTPWEQLEATVATRATCLSLKVPRLMPILRDVDDTGIEYRVIMSTQSPYMWLLTGSLAAATHVGRSSFHQLPFVSCDDVFHSRYLCIYLLFCSHCIVMYFLNQSIPIFHIISCLTAGYTQMEIFFFCQWTKSTWICVKRCI